mgnify:CR=1 FL=1
MHPPRLYGQLVVWSSHRLSQEMPPLPCLSSHAHSMNAHQLNPWSLLPAPHLHLMSLSTTSPHGQPTSQDRPPIPITNPLSTKCKKPISSQRMPAHHWRTKEEIITLLDSPLHHEKTSPNWASSVCFAGHQVIFEIFRPHFTSRLDISPIP